MSCLHRSDASDLERLVPRAESNLGRPFCVHSSESKTSTASPKKSSYTSVRCLPGGSVVKNALQRRRRRFGPWAGTTPRRRAWQPPPVFLPGTSHAPRRLAVQPMGSQRLRHDGVSEHAHTHVYTYISPGLRIACLLFTVPLTKSRSS